MIRVTRTGRWAFVPVIMLMGCVPHVGLDEIEGLNQRIPGRTTIYIPPHVAEKKVTYKYDIYFTGEMEFGNVFVDATEKTFAKYFQQVIP